MLEQELELTKPETPAHPDHSVGLIQSMSDKMSAIFKNPVEYLLLPLGQILLIVLITLIALRLVNRLIDHILKLSKTDSKRAVTMSKLIKSTARYSIYFIALLMILDRLGVNMTPVLAGAGILGLAIGFGAQNLVRDVITGFFLIFENQLEVGDFVEINGQITGTVEEIGLRVTKIREWNQRLHYISNGEITQVTNYNRDRMRAIVTVTVPYESDLGRVHEVLEEVCRDIHKRFSPYLLEEPSVFGVTNIERDGVQFTVTALSDPQEVWRIERELRKTIITAFQEHDIEVAYPRQILMSPPEIAMMRASTQPKESSEPPSTKKQG
ncbi:mechanosensitive ion channel protein MscS [Polycladomyces abyssicola]|uniref:Mechanosensitive ion channel protein MscS n=1 Tax=Polycladomyces abyssicola TaxID=1125966 RepID=A0A8D5UH01_9BACL|nr:mechanosensitive ion channel family protein [Polycladomyces abyssicola]BCU82969.1 mechanosensitive ion channel protein MscS [Polycladomyces abyssicola]